MLNSYPHPVSEHSYSIAGMTCGHCVMSVREEVEAIAGVGAVDVDLASGRLSITGDQISDDAVKAAVAEAGYEVIS
jgi:copper chaperone